MPQHLANNPNTDEKGKFDPLATRKWSNFPLSLANLTPHPHKTGMTDNTWPDEPPTTRRKFGYHQKQTNILGRNGANPTFGHNDVGAQGAPPRHHPEEPEFNLPHVAVTVRWCETA